MLRRLALLFVLLMFAVLAWALFAGGRTVTIMVNGRPFSTPCDAIIDIWGLILMVVILFCVAILPAFVFAGVGLIVLGALTLVGLVLAAVVFPFLLPLLAVLFIVWLFCSIAHWKKAA